MYSSWEVGAESPWELAAKHASSPLVEAVEPVGPLVTLNVYDLADIGLGVDIGDALGAFNKHLLGTWQVGVFHAGVEISGVEYSFGYCERGTGVYSCEPRGAYGAKFRTKIEMGRAGPEVSVIEQRLSRLVRIWSGASYAIVSRNCCHFCDALCLELGVGAVPAWVNGLAESFGAFSGVPRSRTLVESFTERARRDPAFRAHKTPELADEGVTDDGADDAARAARAAAEVGTESFEESGDETSSPETVPATYSKLGDALLRWEWPETVSQALEGKTVTATATTSSWAELFYLPSDGVFGFGAQAPSSSPSSSPSSDAPPTPPPKRSTSRCFESTVIT